MTIHRIWNVAVGNLPARKAIELVKRHKEAVDKGTSWWNRYKYQDYYFTRYHSYETTVEIIETS